MRPRRDRMHRRVDPRRRVTGYHEGMQQITVRYFAAAAEAAGSPEEQLQLCAPVTLESLRQHLADRYGAQMQQVMRTGSFLVDGVVRRDNGEVRGAVVEVLPPFAGG